MRSWERVGDKLQMHAELQPHGEWDAAVWDHAAAATATCRSAARKGWRREAQLICMPMLMPYC